MLSRSWLARSAILPFLVKLDPGWMVAFFKIEEQKLASKGVGSCASVWSRTHGHATPTPQPRAPRRTNINEGLTPKNEGRARSRRGCEGHADVEQRDKEKKMGLPFPTDPATLAIMGVGGIIVLCLLYQFLAALYSFVTWVWRTFIRKPLVDCWVGCCKPTIECGQLQCYTCKECCLGW